MGIAGTRDTFHDQFDPPYGVQRVQADIMKKWPFFVANFGGLSYARGVGFLWDVWGDQISQVARRAPYMVSVGNHEYDHKSGAEKDPASCGLGYHPDWGNFGDDSGGECGVPVQK